MTGDAFFSAAVSHVGCVRSLNEDACLDDPDHGLWAVADGMGGHEAGDVAAQAIVGALAALMGDGTAEPLEDRVVQVTQTLETVHRSLVAEAAVRGGTVGSTVVVCVAGQGRLACLWAGDSRCYRWRDGTLDQVSRDHSYVQDLTDLGVITAQQAREHPRGNIITRAVGAGPSIDIETRFADYRPGDRVLLCSDGLNRMVEDDEIAELLSRDRSPAQVCDDLMGLSLARGARDNVTLVVVDCAPAPIP